MWKDRPRPQRSPHWWGLRDEHNAALHADRGIRRRAFGSLVDEPLWEEIRTIRYYISSLHYRARTDPDIFAQWYALGHMDYATMLRAAQQFRAAEIIPDTIDDEDDHLEPVR